MFRDILCIHLKLAQIMFLIKFVYLSSHDNTDSLYVNSSFNCTTKSLYVFLIYLGSMSVITMKSNLNLQGLLHRGDRKFASTKSSVTDSSSRNFQYLAKKSSRQNYLAILTGKKLFLRS